MQGGARRAPEGFVALIWEGELSARGKKEKRNTNTPEEFQGMKPAERKQQALQGLLLFGTSWRNAEKGTL